MNQPPCYLCGEAAYWRGVVRTSWRFACDHHKRRLELLVSPVPFQASHVRVVARESGTVRAALPGGGAAVSPSVMAPPPGNFDPEAA